MARIYQNQKATGKRILLVDDQEDYLMTMSALIKREGHEVITVKSGEEALELIHKEHFDLLLLDYFMPGGMTGEDLVTKIRTFNKFVQIVLQTGYPGEIPPRDMLKKLDIQGYHDKTDGPEKLLLWVDVGLKAAYTLNMLNNSRQGLKYILDVTPDLHRIQSLEDLLQGILIQLSGLLDIGNSFLAVHPGMTNLESKATLSEVFVAVLEEETNLVIRAGTGRFAEQSKIIKEDFPNMANEIKGILEVMQTKKTCISQKFTVLPLNIGELSIGVIYLDREISNEQDIELIRIFSNQAAVAIQNARLYEMAAIDSLTKVYVKRFFHNCLLSELRNAFRSQKPVSFLMMDLDKFKNINDKAGHLEGDKVLALIGKILLKTVRSMDLVGRFGGDEFVVLLPNSKLDSAKQVAIRIIAALEDKYVEAAREKLAIHLTIGIAELALPHFDPTTLPHPIFQDYFEKMGNVLIESADKNLYKAKRDGIDLLAPEEPIKWIEIEAAKPASG